MKHIILVALSQLMIGCVMYDHVATTKSGNSEHDRLFSFGGTTSQRGADGSSMVHDHQQSFRDGMVAVGAGIGAYQEVKVNASNNAASNYNAAAGVAKQPPTVLTNTAADGSVTQTAIPFVPPPIPK